MPIEKRTFYSPLHFERRTPKTNDENLKFGVSTFNPSTQVYPDLIFDRSTCKPMLLFISSSSTNNSGRSKLLAKMREHGIYGHNFLGVAIQTQDGEIILLSAMGKCAFPNRFENWLNTGKTSIYGKIEPFRGSLNIRFHEVSGAAYLHAEHAAMLSIEKIESEGNLDMRYEAYEITWDETFSLLAKFNEFYEFYAQQDLSLVVASQATTYQVQDANTEKLVFQHQSNKILFESTIQRINQMKRLATQYANAYLSQEQDRNLLVLQALLVREIPLAICAAIHARMMEFKFAYTSENKKYSCMSLEQFSEHLPGIIQCHFENIKNSIGDELLEIAPQLQNYLFSIEQGLRDKENFIRKYRILNFLAQEAQKISFPELKKTLAKEKIFHALMAEIFKIDIQKSSLSEIMNAAIHKVLENKNDILEQLDIVKIKFQEYVNLNEESLPLPSTNSIHVFDDVQRFIGKFWFVELEAMMQLKSKVTLRDKEIEIVSLISDLQSNYVEAEKKPLNIDSKDCPDRSVFIQGQNDCRTAALSIAKEAIGFVPRGEIGTTSRTPLTHTVSFRGRRFDATKLNLRAMMPPSPEWQNPLNHIQMQALEHIYIHYRYDATIPPSIYQNLRNNIRHFHFTDGDLNPDNIKSLATLLDSQFKNDKQLQILVKQDALMQEFVSRRHALYGMLTKYITAAHESSHNLLIAIDRVMQQHFSCIQVLNQILSQVQTMLADPTEKNIQTYVNMFEASEPRLVWQALKTELIAFITTVQPEIDPLSPELYYQRAIDPALGNFVNRFQIQALKHIRDHYRYDARIPPEIYKNLFNNVQKYSVDIDSENYCHNISSLTNILGHWFDEDKKLQALINQDRLILAYLNARHSVQKTFSSEMVTIKNWGQDLLRATDTMIQRYPERTADVTKLLEAAQNMLNTKTDESVQNCRNIVETYQKSPVWNEVKMALSFLAAAISVTIVAVTASVPVVTGAATTAAILVTYSAIEARRASNKRQDSKILANIENSLSLITVDSTSLKNNNIPGFNPIAMRR